MGGIFGGGQRSVTAPASSSVSSLLSPAQERLIEALSPLQTEFSSRQLGAGISGIRGLERELPFVRDDLESALTTGSREEAIPGITSAVNIPLAMALQDRLPTLDATQFGLLESMGDIRGMAPSMTSLAERLSSSDRTGPDSPLATTIAGLRGPSPRSILAPLEESFRTSVIPSISSAAIRAGAPGGSVEGDLVTRATGEFGRMATAQLDADAAARAQAIGNLEAVLSGKFTGAADITGGAAKALTGQSALAATLSGITGLEGDLATRISGLALSGPREGVGLDALIRQLGLSRAQMPIALEQALLNAAGGFPSLMTPFGAPGSLTTTSGSSGRIEPTTGAQVGAGLGQLATLAAILMS